MTLSNGRGLRMLVLAVVICGLVMPILAGLAETAAAAFGHLPAIGAEGFSLDPWRQLLERPGFATSLRLTLQTGFTATFLALCLAMAGAARFHDRIGGTRLARLMTPLLATPHAALAIGLGFLIAPSGWIARLFSPWATGWGLPPDIATVHDGYGAALIFGLVVKETPFFLLLILAGLTQIPLRRRITTGRSLGYGEAATWLKIILPEIYPLIRLPVYVVLSFALSVVDMAIILGPSNPPVLAAAVSEWFLAADTRLILPASAAAMLQMAVVALGIALWWLGERLVAAAGRRWIRGGGRAAGVGPLITAMAGLATLLMTLGALALAGLLIWSVAWRWSFPAPLPESWSLAAWMNPGGGWGRALWQTVVIGLATTFLSLLLAIAWLEGEDRARLPRAGWAEMLVYLPLLVPQIAFLYGLNVAFLRAGIPGGLVAVVWAQVLFVFPYLMIALSDPWRALDPHLTRAAAALGAGPFRRLWSVKLPVLAQPVMVAAAIGFAVSVAQYLPTLFLGAGRIATLTTEAVTLSSGSDRRITGVYAVLQAVLPLIAYGAALALPALGRRRAGLGRAAA